MADGKTFRALRGLKKRGVMAVASSSLRSFVKLLDRLGVAEFYLWRRGNELQSIDGSISESDVTFECLCGRNRSS